MTGPQQHSDRLPGAGVRQAVGAVSGAWPGFSVDEAPVRASSPPWRRGQGREGWRRGVSRPKRGQPLRVAPDPGMLVCVWKRAGPHPQF